MPSTKAPASEKSSGGALENPPVIVDLGLKSAKRVNKMKKGEGPLYDTVCETVEAMQANGVVNKNAQVVLVVVEKMPGGFSVPSISWN